MIEYFMVGTLVGAGLVVVGVWITLERYFATITHTEDIIEELVNENLAYKKVIENWKEKDICKVTNIECSDCQPVCSSRKENENGNES